MKFEDEIFNEYIVFNKDSVLNMISEFTTNMLKRDFEFIESGGRCYFTGLPGITRADRDDVESSTTLNVDKTKSIVIMSVLVHNPVKLQYVLDKYGVVTIDEFVELAVYRYIPTGLTLSLIAMKHLLQIIQNNHPALVTELAKRRVVNRMCNN